MAASLPEDTTDLTTLTGPNGEYTKLVTTCFKDPTEGNLTWQAARTYTLKNFLDAFAAGNPIRRGNLQLWIKHHNLNAGFEKEAQPSATTNADGPILEVMGRIENKLDDLATISRAMSIASPDFTRALLGDKGIRITTLPLCAEIQDPTFQNRMYTWGENEDEKDGQPGCKQILEEELLPLWVDDRELGIFDVRGVALPEVREGGRKSNGFSDLAIGDLVTLSAPHTRDLTFNLSPALIELKTGKAALKPGQLLLQLVSLSAISNQRRGVVVLGTDCATKWRLVYFSKFDVITIQQYTCGKKCLADLTSLLKSSTQNGETLIVPPRLPRIDETGFEQNANQEPSADLNAFVDQLAGLFPSERESLLSVMEDGHSRPPPMIYL